ncbi:hypothetical protein NLG97_g5033 [Lecanicillium saksenae]|uniref:Uncharacterized protein n=1 Tax=Lecanicillium saksenae TaxID=468837 RepID=A0ACC1QU56_9HYPO|nr:hypothetical protein NLG97_g5033 [Lecanicillium saksenae]
MKLLYQICAIFAVLAQSVFAFSKSGLIGLGLDFFDPLCGYACANSLVLPLNCTADTQSAKEWVVLTKPPPECRGQSQPYLRTLAYCLQQYCLNNTESGISLPQVIAFWRETVQVTKDVSIPSYEEAIQSVKETPKIPVTEGRQLNYTGYVSNQLWDYQKEWLITYRSIEMHHQSFGLAIFVSCACIPILLSLIRFLPWPPTFVSKFRGYVIDPPFIGKQHSQAIRGVFMMPTRGQGVFIIYIWLINIILAAVGYRCNSGNTCNPSDPMNEINRLHSVGNRLGVLSFANLPLLILFAGRNNMILWVTNWSRTTFLFIHRYIAFITMGEAVAHAVIFMYINGTRTSHKDLITLLNKPYWIAGCIATLSFIILVITAVQSFRKRFYELFVVIHLFFTALVLAGCYVHNFTRFGTHRGHEVWLYIASGIWAFDRITRAVRYLSRGVRTAYISNIDEDYVRVDIPGVKARGHIYVHFLAISKWRLWESHPFSVGSITSWRQDKHLRLEATNFRKNFNFFDKVEAPRAGAQGRHASAPGGFNYQGNNDTQAACFRQEFSFGEKSLPINGLGASEPLYGAHAMALPPIPRDSSDTFAASIWKDFNFFEKSQQPGVQGVPEQPSEPPRMESFSTRQDSSDTACMKAAGYSPPTSEDTNAHGGTGITLLIRREKGITARLKDFAPTIRKTPVLIEGSYNEEMTRVQENHVRPTDEFPNIICVAAGVGITGALPFLEKFEPKRGQFYTKKLVWAVRSMPLVQAVEDMLIAAHDTDAAERRWGDVDVKLCVDKAVVPLSLYAVHRPCLMRYGVLFQKSQEREDMANPG